MMTQGSLAESAQRCRALNHVLGAMVYNRVATLHARLG